MIIFYSQSNYRAGILLIMKVVNSVIEEGEVEVNSPWRCLAVRVSGFPDRPGGGREMFSSGMHSGRCKQTG